MSSLVFWSLIAFAVCIGLLAWEIYIAPDEYDLWDDGADGRAPEVQERQARTTLYSLRSYERRTEHVVPMQRVGRTDKWT